MKKKCKECGEQLDEQYVHLCMPVLKTAVWLKKWAEENTPGENDE